MTFEERAQEIKDFVASGNLDRSAKRIMDFANEYSENKDIKNTAIIINRDFAAIRIEENRFGRDSNTPKRKNEVSWRILKIINEIEAEVYVKLDNIKSKKLENVFLKNESVENIIEPKQKKCILGVTKLYKKFDSFQLGPIDLELKAGQITGLVGPNGSGKSTLLKILAHEIKPTKGTVVLPQLKSKRWVDIKRYLCYIPQEIWIERDEITVEDELIYWFSCHNIKGDKNKSLVEEILLRLDLQGDRDKNPSNLSGGEKLRFELAKIFGLKPSLIILDEPLANLDIKAQDIFLEDIRNLADSVKHFPSIIVSSQHLVQIESIANNIVFLNKGDVEYNGKKSDIGKGRKANAFELEVDIALEDLLDVLRKISPNNSDIKAEKTNNIFLIKSPTNITLNNIVKQLIANNIDIKYMRDISFSTKNIFKSLKSK